MINRERIIQNYIDGYNQFDSTKMVKDFTDDIVFENVQGGTVNLSLSGLASFKQQAEQAKNYFSERKQTIESFKHLAEKTEIEISYYAVAAMDFPNGLKRGQEFTLKGKSIFEFSGDKICKLTDIS